MRLRYAVLVALLMWAISAYAFADQPCKDPKTGRFISCDDLTEQEKLPVENGTWVAPPPPVPETDSDFAMDLGAGAIASLSSDASSAEPTADLSAAFDLAENVKSPRLSLLARFGALPGETVSFGDPSTFRSLGIEGTLSQPLWSNLRVRPAVQVGAEFRFNGDEEPLHRAARYGYIGGRVEGEDGYLFLGIGGDERLSTSDRTTPAYLPAVAVTWRVKLGRVTGAIDAALVGRVLLFARLGYYGQDSAGSDVAQVGVLVSVGGKR